MTGIPLIPTLDLRALSATQHEAAKDAFQDLAGERLLPFNQIDEDTGRAELDRRLFVDVLQLDPGLCGDAGPLDRLRRKLAAEPQIQGGKQSRLVFTEDGEKLVRLERG